MTTDFPTASVGTSQAPTAAVEKSQSASHTEILTLPLRLNMPVHVCHFPPATSKWNKIEDRMFCRITRNWTGRPLVSHDVIIELITHTTTRAGLKIRAEPDPARYPTGTKISDDGLATLNLKRHKFHGDLNYTLLPTRR